MDHQIRVDVEAVSYAYEDAEQSALTDIDFQVKKGEFVAVLGHNGSGKSTLAKLINALYLPTKGRVVVCGMDTAKEKEAWVIRRHAGMVFQNPDNQIVATVVREDVAFGLENLGVPTQEMIPRIDSALSAVRMTEFAGTAPHMLSGGQKQRVAIAGILAMQPDVLVLDEATAMLDPTGRRDVLDTVRKLNQEHDITVIWITHFMEEAAIADRVVIMSDGHVVLSDTPKNVFQNVQTLRTLQLDVPPMAELNQELMAAGMPMESGILTVEEMVRELRKILCPSK